MSEKVIERCNYCGEMHEQDKAPFKINGIPVKVCPMMPRDEFHFTQKSAFNDYVNELAKKLQTEAEKQNIGRFRSHWDYLFNRPSYQGIEKK